MREDYDEIGHYVRSLSRILLLIAVIIAVPLILSTITAFVRNQSNVSTFHDLLATASVNGLGRTTIAEPTKERTVYTAAGEMGRSAGGENRGESGVGVAR